MAAAALASSNLTSTLKLLVFISGFVLAAMPAGEAPMVEDSKAGGNRAALSASQRPSGASIALLKALLAAGEEALAIRGAFASSRRCCWLAPARVCCGTTTLMLATFYMPDWSLAIIQRLKTRPQGFNNGAA